MATPDYLEQVVISGRRRSPANGASGVRFGLLYRPSVTSLIWAALDLLTIAVAALMALGFRAEVPSEIHPTSLLPFLLHSAGPIALAYFAWYGFLVVILARSYGLYG